MALVTMTLDGWMDGDPDPVTLDRWDSHLTLVWMDGWRPWCLGWISGFVAMTLRWMEPIVVMDGWIGLE